MRAVILLPSLLLLASLSLRPVAVDSPGDGRQLSQKGVQRDDKDKLFRAPEAPAFFNLEELKILPKDSKLTQLYKLRLNAARDAIESRYKEWVAGRGTQAFLIRSAEDLLTFPRLRPCRHGCRKAKHSHAVCGIRDYRRAA